jgi:hypothetical protein
LSLQRHQGNISVSWPAKIDKLGLDHDGTEELVWLVAFVPPESRIAYLLAVYDDLCAAKNEPGASDF